MGINTLTPRYLNLDNDSRIIAAQEMIDAQNVRISADDDGNQGVVKNIAGNVNRTGNGLGYSVGNNTIVGAYEHEGTNRFFVFVYNSTGYNTIYELEQGSNSFTKIIESANILLSGDPLHINGMLIDGELFLYFTDGTNEPQKVNVDTTVAVGSYPPAQASAAVMKLSPSAPSVEFSTDSNRTSNEIFGKSFQFALQYVYNDGEVSAIGEYSENLCSPNTLNSSIVTPLDEDTNFNKIIITDNGIIGFNATLIPKVRVYFRDVKDSTMFKVGEFEYNEIISGVDFYNDGVYPVVSDAEYNKLQDAVPRSAKAQTISGNRLFYGNYVEGFDKATVSASLTVNYEDESVGTDLTMSSSSATDPTVLLNTTGVSSLVGTGQDVNVIVDYTLANASVGKYNVNTPSSSSAVVRDTSGSIVTTVTTNHTFEVKQDTKISKSVTITNPTSSSDFRTKLAAELNGLQFTIGIPTSSIDYTTDWAFKWEGFAVVELSASATGTGVDITNNIIAFNLVANTVKERTGSGSTPSDYTDTTHTATLADSGVTTSVTAFDYGENSSIAYQGNLDSKTFKSSETHAIGVVFEDQYGRTTGVYELGSVEVEELGARALGERGIATIDSVLTVSGLDSALTKYFYVYSGGSSIEKYLQFGVTEAITAVSEDVKKQFSEDAIYVSLRSIEGKGQSINSRGGDLVTGFSKGDKLRILAYNNSGRQYPESYVFDVAGVYTTEEATNLNGDNDFQSIGSFLVLENADYEGFSISYVGTSDSLWESDVLVEVYTPKKENETRIYRAISQKYNTQAPISNIGQTQTLTEGNAWYKRRLVQYKGGADRLVSEYEFVESQQYNDLDSSSKGDLGGKPYAVIENEKEQSRISSLTYSDPQSVDSAQNNLSSFNNSLANFADYEMNYGGIFGLCDMSDSIMMLQSDKVSRIPLSRQILATGTGSEFVTQSTDILGLQQHYGGNFGINEDRTAFLKADGTVYLVDVTRSKIVALTEQGVNLLSDKSVSTFVDERSKSMLADAQGYYVSIGYDKENKEVLFSLQNKPLTNTKSLVYSVGLDKFTTFVDYTGTFYGTLGNRFFQVRDNQVWEAEQNSIYGSFFGLQYDAYIEAVFNQDPTSRKVYNAIGVDATANPSATITTIDQEVSMSEGLFSLKEGVYYGHVPREEGTSQFVVLGEVQSENDPEITMKAKVNRLPFRLGGDVYKLDAGVFTQIAGVTADSLVSPRVLSMSNAGAVTAGDEIAVKGASVDGDPIRGAYAEVKLTFNDATAFELFAVSAHTSESGLHNNSQQ